MSEGEHVAQRSEDGGDAVDPLLKAIGKQIKFLRAGRRLRRPGYDRTGYSIALAA